MKIDTTLRQWCKTCEAATVTRRCVYPPDVCCSRCCTPGRPQCDTDADTDDWWEDDEDWWEDDE